MGKLHDITLFPTVRNDLIIETWLIQSEPHEGSSCCRDHTYHVDHMVLLWLGKLWLIIIIQVFLACMVGTRQCMVKR